MKIFKSLPAILFILSFLMVSLFSSSVMILCSKTNVCHSDLNFIVHHMEKLLTLSTGIIVFLVLLFKSKFISKLENYIEKDFHNIRPEYLKFLNDISFDYLKRIFSKGILRSKIYELNY